MRCEGQPPRNVGIPQSPNAFISSVRAGFGLETKVKYPYLTPDPTNKTLASGRNSEDARFSAVMGFSNRIEGDCTALRRRHDKFHQRDDFGNLHAKCALLPGVPLLP